MDGNQIQEWIAPVVALAGVIASIISYFVGRREKQNEIVGRTAESIATGFDQLVQGLERRLARLEQDKEELTERVRELEQIKIIQERRIKELENKNGIDNDL